MSAVVARMVKVRSQSLLSQNDKRAARQGDVKASGRHFSFLRNRERINANKLRKVASSKPVLSKRSLKLPARLGQAGTERASATRKNKTRQRKNAIRTDTYLNKISKLVHRTLWHDCGRHIPCNTSRISCTRYANKHYDTGRLALHKQMKVKRAFPSRSTTARAKLSRPCCLLNLTMATWAADRRAPTARPPPPMTWRQRSPRIHLQPLGWKSSDTRSSLKASHDFGPYSPFSWFNSFIYIRRLSDRSTAGKTSRSRVDRKWILCRALVYVRTVDVRLCLNQSLIGLYKLWCLFNLRIILNKTIFIS